MKILKKILVAILILESRLIIAKYKPFIVAVTGSVGKTSTKDAVYEVLKLKFKYVRKSEKSMNSEIGLPLTVIGAPNAWYSVSGWLRNILAGLKVIISKNAYPDCLVLEVGADHPGDIKDITKWLHTDISIITKISSTPVHVEFFNSPEQLFEEKAYLATAVKDNGYLILYADDEKVMSLKDRVANKSIGVLSFGLNENASVRGVYSGIAIGEDNNPKGFNFDLIIGNEKATVGVNNVIGQTYMYPLLSSATVGVAVGLAMNEIVNALSKYEAPKGRMNIIAGINGSIIIDDTYNSSPDAVESALKTLSEMKTLGSKIAVLGDMMELGKYATSEHRKIGAMVSKIANVLVTVGPRSHFTAEEAQNSGMPKDSIYSFDDSIKAGKFLETLVKTGDIVLIKGSQSIRMERVTRALLKEPEKADRLLVRQEREWQRK